ncbi:MAG: hypothetical protein HY926_02130 [Elusimicrobia bacterium]|nr:hypothetical protein [Elusimicrobiota bacterium]
MTKKKQTPAQTKSDDSTGTYVYDKELGKVVKKSSRVPKVSSKAGGGGFEMPSGGEGGGCEGCPSGGSCGMGGMGGF